MVCKRKMDRAGNPKKRFYWSRRYVPEVRGVAWVLSQNHNGWVYHVHGVITEKELRFGHPGLALSRLKDLRKHLREGISYLKGRG